MGKSSKSSEPIPASFESHAEAGAFWDNHDLTDYPEDTREVPCEVDLRRRVFLTALEPELAERLGAYALRQGVSAETLVNVWVAEKLNAVNAERLGE